ncbi:hypothetical protein ACWCXX_37590 [Streptomyces sp. NPDC001732]
MAQFWVGVYSRRFWDGIGTTGYGEKVLEHQDGGGVVGVGRTRS